MWLVRPPEHLNQRPPEEDWPDAGQVAPDSPAGALYRTIGLTLKNARTNRHWTRADLCGRLTHPVAPQTIATYEQAIRRYPIDRLMDLCAALGLHMPTVIAKGWEAANPEHVNGTVRIDLTAVLANKWSQLTPLREWARIQLTRNTPTSHIIELTPEAITALADCCESTETGIRRILRNFAPLIRIMRDERKQ